MTGRLIKFLRDRSGAGAAEFAIVALVLIVPFRMYLLQPRQEENASVLERVETLQERNRVAGVLAARGGGDLQERLDLYERHVAKLQELIPRLDQVPALMNNIQAEARRVDVEVQSLDPEPAELRVLEGERHADRDEHDERQPKQNGDGCVDRMKLLAGRIAAPLRPARQQHDRDDPSVRCRLS